jgi:signal transduction histidine kinase
VIKAVPSSLTARLALLTAAWVTAGLVVAWVLVSGVAASYIERSFDDRLADLLDAVVAGTELEPDGAPVLQRPVSEPRFDRPYSGVYWQIAAPGGRLATSRSLWDQALPTSPPDQAGVQMRRAPGPAGQHLRIAARDIALPDGDAKLQVLVAIAHDDVHIEISRLRRTLAFGFAVVGVGLVAATVLQVSLLLAPLRRLRRAVAELRAGRRGALHIRAGAEVQPLITEIDALVAQNRATVERARGHVGNLAHALRTSLAVIRNALEAPGAPDTGLVRREVAAAEGLVAHHLGRARTAGLVGATAEDVPVLAVVEEIAAALRLLFADKGLCIRVAGDASARARCERQDLAEMVGNLMENACKWGRARVQVEVRAEKERVVVSVADDGPGLAADQMTRALARGTRFDEAAPGSGLGLAITKDLVGLYGGELSLGAADTGGLEARLFLMRAPSAGEG